MRNDVGSIGAKSVSAAVAIIGIGMLCTASVAIAGIISGSVSTNQSNNAKVTQLVISEPSGVSAGDFLLANIAVAGGSEADVTAPAGWTAILRTDNDTDVSIISYYKFASVSEPGNYTWSVDHQTNAEGGISAYSGVDKANPIDAVSGNSGYGTVATTSPLATSAPNAEIVMLSAADVGRKANAGDYFSTPASTTEKYDASNTPFGPSIASDDMLQTAAGTSSSKSSIITGKKPRDWVTQQVALRMSSPGIIFDSASAAPYQENAATETWSHTISGTSTLLIVCGTSYGSDLTGATYDGVPMILLKDIPGTEIGANTYMACYGLVAAHTGTHSIVLSKGGSFLWIEGLAESFSNVAQTGLPDAIAGDHQINVSPYVATLSTRAASTWGLIYGFNDTHDVSAGTGTTIRQTDITGSEAVIADSAGPWTLAGPHQLSLVSPSNSEWDSILISFAPAN